MVSERNSKEGVKEEDFAGERISERELERERAIAPSDSYIARGAPVKPAIQPASISTDKATYMYVERI